MANIDVLAWVIPVLIGLVWFAVAVYIRKLQKRDGLYMDIEPAPFLLHENIRFQKFILLDKVPPGPLGVMVLIMRILVFAYFGFMFCDLLLFQH